MSPMLEYRLGGQAGDMKGFTHTWKCMDTLDIEEELLQDVADPQFVLRNIDLSPSSAGQAAAITEGYLRRKEVQRIVCSQCLLLAGFLPRLFDHMADVDRKTKNMALNGPLIGIVGAGGQLGSAVTQTLLDFGWKPFRIAVSGRDLSKLRQFEALGVGVFEDVSLLVRAVRLVIVAVGPQHARQVGSTMGDAGTGSCLALSTLAGISEASLRRVLGAQHLLQTRLDMAQLEITEKMGVRDNSSRVGETAPSSAQNRPVSGDADHGATSGNGSCDSFEACQAIHQRAARHLFPDVSAAGRLFGTLESFFAGQGLDTTQAHDASRDWLSCPVEPEEHTHTVNKTRPQLPSCGGRATAEASVESRSDQQPEKYGLSGRAASPGGGGGTFSGRKPPLLSSPEAPQSQQGLESHAPSLNKLLPEAAADERTITGTNDGARTAARVDPGTDPAEGGNDKYAREERALTASSLRSVRSAGSPSRSPRKPLPSPRRRQNEIGGNMEEEWMPRLKWPPPDLVVVGELCKKVLFTPYGNAVRDSGYQDS